MLSSNHITVWGQREGRLITLQSIVSASNDQVSSPLGDELVILDTQSGVYFGLNPMSAFIWKLIQQPTPVIALRDAILNEFEVERAVCETDLLNILNDLNDNGLIHIQE